MRWCAKSECAKRFSVNQWNERRKRNPIRKWHAKVRSVGRGTHQKNTSDFDNTEQCYVCVADSFTHTQYRDTASHSCRLGLNNAASFVFPYIPPILFKVSLVTAYNIIEAVAYFKCQIHNCFCVLIRLILITIDFAICFVVSLILFKTATESELLEPINDEQIQMLFRVSIGLISISLFTFGLEVSILFLYWKLQIGYSKPSVEHEDESNKPLLSK